MWICGIAFGIAGLCMVLASRHVPDLSDRTAWSDRTFWIWSGLIAVLYIGGAVGAIALGLISCFRIRCPRCGKRLGPPPKRWKYCPLCGVDFDSKRE
jgi:hypothetical protein